MAATSFFATFTNPEYVLVGQSQIRPIALAQLQSEYTDASPYLKNWLWDGTLYHPLSDISTYSHLVNGTNLGLPFHLGKKLSEFNAKKTYILMRAEGGSSLGEELVTGIDAWDSVLVGENWTKFQTDWTNSRAWFTETSKTPDTKGLGWFQGIRDSQVLAQANAYQVNLDAWLTAAKATNGIQNFLIAKTHNTLPIGTYPHKATVRAAQEAVAAARADTVIIDTDSFEVGPDDVHFSPAGTESLSQACFDIMKTW